MRRAAKFLGAVVDGLVLLVVVVLAAVVGGSATQPGRAAIERLVPSLSGRIVHAAGLSGSLLGASGSPGSRSATRGALADDP